ncbi:MAG TPA: hypothetical protein VJT73_00445 [Polyangiaceae bacterium]|nr:hypothetical protein [Polyangiaceae bacterium]
MKPVLLALGIGMMILGFLGINRVAWLGWAEVAIGIAAVLAAAQKLPRAGAYAGVGLGIATLVVWVAALASGVVGWLAWLSFVFGVAFILTSPMVSRPNLPPGAGGGPRFPR